MSPDEHRSSAEAGEQLECLACGHVGVGRADGAGGRGVAMAFAAILGVAGCAVWWSGSAADGVILFLLATITVVVARLARPLRMCEGCGSGSVIPPRGRGEAP